MIILAENLSFFKMFWHFYQIFHENFGKNYEKFINMHLNGDGGEAPEASKFIKIIVDESTETYYFWQF